MSDSIKNQEVSPMLELTAISPDSDKLDSDLWLCKQYGKDASVKPDTNLIHLLKDLQGNILKSHGRQYSVHIFVKFNEINTAKDWIRNLAKTVTSAKEQWEDSKNRRDSIERIKQKNQSISTGGTSDEIGAIGTSWNDIDIFQVVRDFKAKAQDLELFESIKDSIKNFFQGQDIFTNFCLSAAGYSVLGYPAKDKLGDIFFRRGMKDRANLDRLNDPILKKWDEGFQKEIHGLILLASDNQEKLGQRVEELINDINDNYPNAVEVIHIETGKVFKNERQQAIEHFGYVDGVSQPLFFKKDIERSEKQDWDPSAPLGLVLQKDPFGEGDYSFGSYCVYRKLKQNVDGFHTRMKALAAELKLQEKLQEKGLPEQEAEKAAEELAGAFVMGRFKDGTPVTLSSHPQYQDLIANDFNYNHDLQGAKCPFQGHIRRVNPRGAQSQQSPETPEQQRQHRIVRRGTSYSYQDSKLSPTSLSFINSQLLHLKDVSIEAKDEDKGLLFICFQSSIENQFAFMQTKWANQPNFPEKNIGQDPVIGQGLRKAKDGQTWPLNWDDVNRMKFEVSGFVEMRGGEYFFAPSISFLRQMKPFS